MDFTNEKMLQIAMEQSTSNANCQAEDFLCLENVVVLSLANLKARKYVRLSGASFGQFGQRIAICKKRTSVQKK